MAIPSQPTDTSIVTQAYKDFGISSPSSAQIARAISDGIEWVKRDLMNLGHEWKFMIKSGYIITQVGVNNYAVPTDYLKYLSARILEGTNTGTAQAGSTTTITIAASDTSSTSVLRGKTIVITGGTGSGQGAQIASYNSGTKVVTFDVALTVAPDNTSTYLIADTYRELTDQTVLDLSDVTIPSISMKPTIIVHVPDSIEGRLMTNYTPDKVYVILLRYYGDLLKEDVTSTRYNTILRLAAGVVTQGVFAWLLQDDSRRSQELGIYASMRRQFANKQLYGYDLSHSQMTTGEE